MWIMVIEVVHYVLILMLNRMGVEWNIVSGYFVARVQAPTVVIL